MELEGLFQLISTQYNWFDNILAQNFSENNA